MIVCFGDSLTAGYGAEPGQSYPDFLQKMLDQQGLRYRVVNEGVSGDTTTGGLGRLDAVLADKPKIVVLELGGNDGLRGGSVATMRDNMAMMIGTLQKAGVTVVLAGITLPPNYGADYIRQFDRVYVDLARKYRTPLLPFLFKDVAFVDGMMQQDGIHATAKGNEVVARNVFATLRPLL